jgi:hypothetical protein
LTVTLINKHVKYETVRGRSRRRDGTLAEAAKEDVALSLGAGAREATRKTFVGLQSVAVTKREISLAWAEDARTRMARLSTTTGVGLRA